jgi:hypothetical protein
MEQPISVGVGADKISVTSTQQLRKPGQMKKGFTGVIEKFIITPAFCLCLSQ